MPLQSMPSQSRVNSIPSSPLRLGTRSGSAPFPPPSNFFLPPQAGNSLSLPPQNELNSSSNASIFSPPSPPPVSLPPSQSNISQRKTVEEKEERENTGRWTMEEHTLFLEGLRTHGKGWKQIAAMIQSRSVVQIRTHAQKYFQKLSKAQSQNGGQPIGEVFMDTRPTDTLSNTNRTSTSQNPSMIDLDTDMANFASTSGANRKANGGGSGSKNSRKPKGSVASGDPSSPRRKRKMETDMSALSLDVSLGEGLGNHSNSLPSNGSLNNGRNTSNLYNATTNNMKRTLKHGNNNNSVHQAGGGARHAKMDMYLSPSPGSVADPLLMGGNLDSLGVSSNSWYHSGLHSEDAHIPGVSLMLPNDGIGSLGHTNTDNLSSSHYARSSNSTDVANQKSSANLGGLSTNHHGFEHPSAHEMLDLSNGLDWFDSRLDHLHIDPLTESHDISSNHAHLSLNTNNLLNTSSLLEESGLSLGYPNNQDQDVSSEEEMSETGGGGQGRLHRLNSDFTDDGSLSDDSEFLTSPRHTAVEHMPLFTRNLNTSSSSNQSSFVGNQFPPPPLGALSIPPPPPPAATALHPLVSPCISSQQPSQQMLSNIQGNTNGKGGLLRPKDGVNNWKQLGGRKTFSNNTSNQSSNQHPSSFSAVTTRETNDHLSKSSSTSTSTSVNTSAYFQQHSQLTPSATSSSNEQLHSYPLDSTLKRPTSPSFTQEKGFTALDEVNLFDDVNFDEDVFVTDLLESNGGTHTVF